MTGLVIPVEFLGVEDLAQRWQCGVSTIGTLAETDKIRFCLRPAALEIALANVSPEIYADMVKRLSCMYLDHRYVYLMFKNKGSKIEVARVGNYDMNKILRDPLCVDFFDLVIPIAQIEDFEFMHSSMCHPENEFELLSDDFTCFIWRGQEYKFGETQAKIIKRLWLACESGNPWVYGKRILKDIDSTCFRIKDIFGKNKYWRRIIISDNKGKYKLNIQPKQPSLFS